MISVDVLSVNTDSWRFDKCWCHICQYRQLKNFISVDGTSTFIISDGHGNFGQTIVGKPYGTPGSDLGMTADLGGGLNCIKVTRKTTV